ncbi:MAG: proton-conducting membrane transporter, partial [Defluviitaleaceae bacterium]|nr:proton-conducting membrane transporter [Defluviitaleaceae bacterium]
RLTGSPDMGRVTELVAVMDYRNFILPYVLIMTSIAFKCYLIPFFSWVPKAQLYPGAPSGVAAILSGLQIKSSIYLFIRFQEIFAPIAAAEFFLVIGIIMGVFGALMAISQSDIKSILAYSTISQVGLIIIGINAGSEYSYIGSLYHIVSHAIFKTTLFLFASIVVRTYRTADVNKIRSVAKRMPAVSIAAAAAVLGIIGAPLFNGSISKYFITYDMGIVLNIIVVLLGFGTILYYSRFIKIFFGKGDIAAEKLEKVWVVPVCFLGIICFVGGIFGTVLINFLFREQVSINVLGYLQKSAYFAVSAIVGFIVHRYFIKSGVIFERLRGMSFNFKTICASLLVFFVCMLLYVGWLL